MGGNDAFREILSGSRNAAEKQRTAGRQHARREHLAARSDQATGEGEQELRFSGPPVRRPGTRLAAASAGGRIAP